MFLAGQEGDSDCFVFGGVFVCERINLKTGLVFKLYRARLRQLYNVVSVATFCANTYCIMMIHMPDSGQ